MIFRTNDPIYPHEYKMIIHYEALTNPGIKVRHYNRIAVFIKGLFEIGGEDFGNHRRDGVTPPLLLCVGFQLLMQA